MLPLITIGSAWGDAMKSRLRRMNGWKDHGCIARDQSKDGRRKTEKYRSGTIGAELFVVAGISFRDARKAAAGYSRHRFPCRKQGHLRTRMLLASPSRVQIRYHAKDERPVLGGEICRERKAGQESNRIVARSGMACPGRLVLRGEGA